MSASSHARMKRPARAWGCCALVLIGSAAFSARAEPSELDRTYFSGEAAVTAGDVTAARTTFRRAIGLASRLEPDEAAWYLRSAHYSLACIEAVAGREGPALEHLEAALANRYWHLDHVEADGDLASIRSTERFATAVAAGRVAFEAAAGKDAAPAARADALSVRWREAHVAGDYRAALPLAEEALALREVTLPPVSPSLAEAHSELGNTLYQLARHEEARDHWARSLSIREETAGPESSQVADDLNNLANAFMALTRFEEAGSAFERALAIRRQLFIDERAPVAESLNNLARLHQEMGYEERARPLLEEAAAIWAQTSGEDSTDHATALNNLARVFLALGDLEEARQLRERTLQIYRAKLPAGHPRIARGLSNLATVLYDVEGLDAARPLFEEALDLYRRGLGEEHPQVAALMTNIGVMFRSAGDVESALPLHEKALASLQRTYGQTHPRVARAHSKLGKTLERLGRRAEAEGHFHGSMAMLEELHGPEHPGLSEPLEGLGVLALQAGDGAAATAYFRRALDLLQAPMGPGSLAAVRARALLADATEEASEARPHWERALADATAILSPGHPEFVRLRRGLARVLLAQGERGLAEEQLRAALAETTLHSLRTLRGLSRRQRLAFLDDSRPLVDQSVATFAQPVDAYRAVLFWKGLALRAAAADQLASRGGGEAESVREELRSVAARLDFETRRELDPDRKNDAARRDARLDDLRARLAKAELHLSRLVPREATLNALAGVGPEDLAAALGHEEALIEFLESEGRLHAWILRPGRSVLGRLHLAHVDLGPAAKARANVEALRDSILASESVLRFLEVREESFRLLWEPLAGHVRGARRLYLALDAPVADLPLAVLPGTPRDDGRPSFLLEDVSLSYLVAGADLLRSQRFPFKPSADRLLAVGGVNYDSRDRSEPAPVSALRAEEALVPDHQVMSHLRGSATRRRWEALPATAEEASTIARLHRSRARGDSAPESAEILGGAEATVDAVIGALEGHRYLHLATHGFFPAAETGGGGPDAGATRGAALAPRRPVAAAHVGQDAEEAEKPSESSYRDAWLETGLVLAGANGAADSADNGLLTALELSSLDLSGVELCVLSSCGSGLGEAHGGQGVIGLGAALMGAGVRSLVMSLWSVPDEATRQLMERYYHQLWSGPAGGTVGKAEALRRAQLKLLAAGREAGHDHPFRWGAWIHLGED